MSAETILQTKWDRIAGVAGPVTAVGNEYSLWQFDGNPSGGGVPPTTYANPDNTTAGSLMQVDPPAGKQKWIQSAIATANIQGRLVLYDRLLHISGLSGTVTTAQNVNGGSAATLTRHYADDIGTLDVGNEIFIEVYTALGVTPTTITATYTNQAGTAAQVTQAATIPASLGVQRLVRLPLAAGDYGVQSITSVTLAGSTGTAGNFGVVVAHRLLEFEVAQNGNPELWTMINERRECMAGACLAWALGATGTSASTSLTMTSFLSFVDY